MPTPETLALFAIAALALLVIPGPAVLYIVTRSIEHGRTAGLVSVLGIHVGTLAHVAAAAFGVSAVLVRSSTAFHAVKWAGAAYLVVLGIRRLTRPVANVDARDVPPAPARQLFTQGVIVNVLNPKTALFFFAFLPQFVDPGRGSVTAQVLGFGVVFVVIGMASDSTYALVAARLGSWLRTSPGFRRGERYVSGGVYLTLGVTAALAGSKTSSTSS